ncbi:hypothetical protein VTJ49DRAFT_6956 [Mycothermus thermophilus]|uniref:B30.2/SPRY domain-containing protein n=1 Tax=Humicola insolens TaxID=85995 RepID=A0ABR3VI73_HUMIN
MAPANRVDTQAAFINSPHVAMEKDNKAKDVKVRTLYDEALERFKQEALESHSSPKDAEALNEFLRERATPEETKQAAESLRGESGKKWGSKKLGDVEIPASWISAIMENIEHFITAGDYLTNNAPESVGMAWYAIKLTLTAIHGNYELYNFFGSGLSDISEIMILIRHYDRLYDERSKPGWKASPLVEKLFQDVTGAYVAVLHFSYSIKRHLTAGTLTRIKHGFKDFFGLSKAKFEEKLGAVATMKKKVLEESQAAFQDRTLGSLQNVSDVLNGIENSVRRIQDFQATQQKLHEEAMARIDLLLKGFDDLRASTKRKTQWDYALQDFQTFKEALQPLEGAFSILGEIIDHRYPGTCEWAFDRDQYQEWSEKLQGLLCVTGLEGSGKSYVVAAIAERMTHVDPDVALVYVSCNPSAVSASGSNQALTADSVCRTALAQLYELAVQGEDNVGLLESCNAIFKKAAQKNSGLPPYLRGRSTGLPDFVDAFCEIAALLKRRVLFVIDGLNRDSLDESDQEELVRNVNGILDYYKIEGVNVQFLVGCASNTKFFTALDLGPSSYIDVQQWNWEDMDMVLTNALKTIPGLTADEQEEAKEAITEKARSRFAYVMDTALPFMREPFQRPLKNRLASLPDGASDVYSKILEHMSPNYLDLLRTALTWTLLSDEWPGLPEAREIMDAFQNTYDVAPEDVTANLDEVEPEFPKITPLELEQLKQAAVPFLHVNQEDDGTVWLWESDYEALKEYFIKDGDGSESETEDPTHLCARCGTVRMATKSLAIDPKEGHLKMALMCLRHLNNPLFQKRAGLLGGHDDSKSKPAGDASEEGQDGPKDGETEGPGDESAPEVVEATDEQEVPETADDSGETKAESGDAQVTPDQAEAHEMDQQILEEYEGTYDVESSIDDEDATEHRFYEFELEAHSDEPGYGEGERQSTRVRYELQYWPFHLRQAQALWSPEERETNDDWKQLMAELDKFAFDTPEVFAAWQRKFPDPAKREAFANGGFCIGHVTHEPLHVAAYLALDSWVLHLLERGEDINGLSDGSWGPLQAAASSKRSFSTIKLLLDKGADINAEYETGLTTFHIWMLRGDVTVENIKTLLGYGADLKTPGSESRFNALQYFARTGKDPAILDLLLENGSEINTFDPRSPLKLSPLHLLLWRASVPLDLLQAFVKHGADTNWENAMSTRPLQMVCHSGQVENLKILLQSEVLEIDDTDLQGTTAVHEAAFWGHAKCVAALLEHNADPDIPDKINRIALHTAAVRGQVECVRHLVKYTKKFNLVDKQSWTPLFCACLRDKEESALLILDVLIENNVPLAEINHPSRSGRTVLRQAAEHGFDTVVTKLLQLAAERGDTASLGLNAQDTKKGMTALHRAAMNGHKTCVKLLIDAGADVSLTDNQSRTALALAYEQWSVATKNQAYEEILELLITAAPSGATSDADLVAICAANGSIKLLKLLGQLNAPLNRPDRYGWTPLNLAKHFNQTETVAFLKQQAAWSDRLPSRWLTRFPGTTSAGAQSVVTTDDDSSGLSIVHKSGKRVCISADRPIPLGLESYYFEVTLQASPEGGTEPETPGFPEMAIGFCTLGGAAIKFPGWWHGENEDHSSAESWGYHSDTGGVYSSEIEVEEDAEWDEARYREGDTVGCGVDLKEGLFWFTKNGARWGRVIKKGADGRLFPVVGLHENVAFVTNFGREGKAFMYQPEAEKKEVEDEEKEGEEVEEMGENGTVIELAIVGDRRQEKTVVTVESAEVVAVEA